MREVSRRLSHYVFCAIDMNDDNVQIEIKQTLRIFRVTLHLNERQRYLISQIGLYQKKIFLAEQKAFIFVNNNKNMQS